MASQLPTVPPNEEMNILERITAVAFAPSDYFQGMADLLSGAPAPFPFPSQHPRHVVTAPMLATQWTFNEMFYY